MLTIRSVCFTKRSSMFTGANICYWYRRSTKRRMWSSKSRKVLVEFFNFLKLSNFWNSMLLECFAKKITKMSHYAIHDLSRFFSIQISSVTNRSICALGRKFTSFSHHFTKWHFAWPFFRSAPIRSAGDYPQVCSKQTLLSDQVECQQFRLPNKLASEIWLWTWQADLRVIQIWARAAPIPLKISLKIILEIILNSRTQFVFNFPFVVSQHAHSPLFSFLNFAESTFESPQRSSNSTVRLIPHSL